MAKGGRVIKQQLVKLLLEQPEVQTQRTVDRKLKEAAMAVEVTKRYDKDQIKRWYLDLFFFSSRRRHTRFDCDWSSDVCSSDLRSASRRRSAPTATFSGAVSKRRRPGCGRASPPPSPAAATGPSMQRGASAAKIGRASCRERV